MCGWVTINGGGQLLLEPGRVESDGGSTENTSTARATPLKYCGPMEKKWYCTSTSDDARGVAHKQNSTCTNRQPNVHTSNGQPQAHTDKCARTRTHFDGRKCGQCMFDDGFLRSTMHFFSLFVCPWAGLYEKVWFTVAVCKEKSLCRRRCQEKILVVLEMEPLEEEKTGKEGGSDYQCQPWDGVRNGFGDFLSTLPLSKSCS